jgi:3-dehydroquinate dehydratase / shikimate dehydrogenase
MNNGKICISVCAETADELIEQIKRAEILADVVEIRFDCLDMSDFDTFLRQFNRKKYKSTFLTTFRPYEQGGKKSLTYDERKQFWIHSHIFEFTDWADLEEDFPAPRIRSIWGRNAFQKIIKSQHNFVEVPSDLFQIYDKLKSEESDIIKIAVQTHDITDAIPIWKLLQKAKSENKQIIPIAMGESGKWTRILGLAHGAFMTYAALDAGQETAPGQVSAKDLTEVYRAKHLNEQTEIYGILGSNTSVSMSPYIHNAAFKFHALNSVFVPLQVQNLDEFIKRMVKPETREIELNFKGFSVTIPHKQTIIKHLDFIDETAKKIGAVNTVKIIDGKLHGYNTDAQGFIEPLLNSYGDLNGAKVAVIGAGGAARACVYALKQSGAEVTIFARDIEKAKNLAEDFKFQISNFKSVGEDYGEFDILVNTTPLGMKGKAEGETPVLAEQLKGLILVYDLVYIPFQTQLMNEADAAEVPKIGGLAMLIAQAMQQQKIWSGLDAPMKEMSRAALKKLN